MPERSSNRKCPAYSTGLQLMSDGFRGALRSVSAVPCRAFGHGFGEIGK